MDLFGIDGDHRGGRRRWTAFAWPLLGGLLGALTGVLLAPLALRLLGGVLPADLPWLLPALIALCVAAMLLLFMGIGRRRRADGRR
jgi:predicted lysophospholipase L1 biosynthesis ABC-type transport system permease subunit